MTFRWIAAAFSLSVWISVCGVASLPAQTPVFHAQGEFAGEVTATSVLLQSRLTAVPGPELDQSGDIPGAAGVARFEWSEQDDLAVAARTDWLSATAERDFIVRAPLTGLKPGRVYFYRLTFGPDREHVEHGPVRRFKTLPVTEDGLRSPPGRLSFCMGSCMNYSSFMSRRSNGGGPVTATEEDRRLGYPAFAAMTTLNPDFFIGTGDIVYYDHPAQTAARTLPELRKKWHEQFRFPRLIAFFAQTPAYWSKDDHDFRYNDADLQGGKLPAPATGIDMFREQMPIHPAGDATSPTYRTHRVHPHVQLWFTEGRDHRSPNKQPDGPQKSMWGPEQKAWLRKTLTESDATWKIIITPTPMVGPDRASKQDNHTNLNGYRHEADEFFQWLKDNRLSNVMTFCGDRHWQYHSIHPLGVEELSVGALNDENAIRGPKPGQPNSTDPEGLIRQPYLYAEPTGGFLHVVVSMDEHNRPSLRIESRDDTGAILNVVTRTKAD